jgi:flavin-dependent thymidylate synthase
MKVELINFTGTPDPLFAPRLLAYTKNTRLTQGGESRARYFAMSLEELMPELTYMANTLRSSWEFIDYTFEITGVTRAFTHQFVRTRTGSYAQQAQRVVDMSGFEYLTPNAFMGDDPDSPEANDKALAKLEVYQDCMATIAASYSQLVEMGAAKQDARGLLPTNIHTNIIAKFNLRTMADLAGKRDNARAQGEYVDVYRAMAQCVLDVHPWAESFLYPERLSTPALEKILAEVLGDRSPIDCPLINDALKELDKLKATWG